MPRLGAKKEVRAAFLLLPHAARKRTIGPIRRQTMVGAAHCTTSRFVPKNNVAAPKRDEKLGEKDE